MSTQYVGEIRPFAGNFAPVGWHFCDGSLLDISSYAVLYNLVGTTYGGNGTTTFGLPDLRGRAVISQGTGTGLSTYVMGQPIGVETVTVTIPTMAGHPHSFNANNAGGTTPTPGTQTVLAAAPVGAIYDGPGNPVGLAANAVGNAGGSVPHNNRQPYLAISYIIALVGVYPQQS
jgi:microcystin-dependent protein